MPAFQNPVLPGCHPDPSVCRVGDTYYLVTSSFGYFPGIPVHRSTDLVHWELVGHVLTRPEQAPLAGLDVNDGVWAATMRHHAGRFYVVATVARGRRGASTFVVTATDPAGPWSDPVPLEADGIDPSLFVDDDGRCWFTATRDAPEPAVTGPAELWLRELDLATLRLTGPEHVLWHGALRGAWVEGPHLYLRDGRYWLIAAEGGTERNHAVTAASAPAVTGPYATDPRSPLLTHRHLGPGHPVQNVGHADLVDTPDGATWALTLGVRPVDGAHTLGREAFLVPVEWTERGPVFAPGTGTVPATGSTGLPGPTAPDDRPGGAEVLTLDAPLAAQGWSSLRGPVDHLVRPADDGRGLALTPTAATLWGTGTPALVARRQQHLRFRLRCRLAFATTSSHEEAGVTVLLHQQRLATLAVSAGPDGEPVARLRMRTGDVVADLAGVPVLERDAIVELVVRGDEQSYRFAVVLPGGDERVLGEVPRTAFATETAGGFLGVHLGVHAQTTGTPTGARAVVSHVSYEALEDRAADPTDVPLVGSTRG
ncbi:glycoside hydrolase family 43 protein [Cellulomonas triticagri]|uniref:Glycoside hydrolase family 43 protein n=1 Tax=Cellulomonas triticagri TaxID=2483352 RepID=A0A3M2J7E6_9CELL|nr:glycoside hydrolase family 43 protein [Cellulomonas triticagri]RMI06865.1 glycoside hydrolase family 43 protein [Cellulomonas triticagri]